MDICMKYRKVYLSIIYYQKNRKNLTRRKMGRIKERTYGKLSETKVIILRWVYIYIGVCVFHCKKAEFVACTRVERVRD